jgi:cytochrome c-type biogenesis protein CcmH
MILILILGAMAMAAACALGWPLIRRAQTARVRSDFERAVFNDQLAELTRDQERGVIGATEAVAARTEIERRALVSLGQTPNPDKDTGAPPSRPRSAIQAFAATLIIALPTAAGVIYAVTGTPDLPGLPFASRPNAPTAAAPSAAPSPEALETLAALIETRVREAPDDKRGWSLLSRLHQRMGNPAATAPVFQSILTADKDAPARAAIALAYGEALLNAADGTVTAKVRAAFEVAYQAQPDDPAARYYRGLALVQQGDPEGALAIWTALQRDGAADAPWRARLNADIERLAQEHGLKLPKPSPATASPK